MVIRDASAEELRALGLSMVFVLGMSVVFVVIGAVAGFLGRTLIFGAWAYCVIAAICVLIARPMLGLIHLPVGRLNALLPVKRSERRGIVDLTDHARAARSTQNLHLPTGLAGQILGMFRQV